MTHAPLAPYAIPHEGLSGRVHPEPEDPLRLPFQRDRARIIHTQAFRRLQGKTQVFVAGMGDHFRTRLTHTMEVAQVARDLARALSLNEDLAECIALAHDLGHPPFGHSGETTLDAWMRDHGSVFEHNEQSLRIVTVLEEHAPGAPGLNLHREILDGMRKHALGHRALSLEARVVDLADEIAYSAHDCDDGLLAGVLSMKDLRETTIPRLAFEHSRERGTSVRGGIIRLLFEDAYATTSRLLQEHGIRTREDVARSPVPLVAFSVDIRAALDELRAFLMERMYTHPAIREQSAEGQAVVGKILRGYEKSPPEKILTLQSRTGSSLIDAIKDYVAGMTDEFARNQALLLR